MEDCIARALQRTREIEELLRGLVLELQDIQQELVPPVAADSVPVAVAVPAPTESASDSETGPRIRVRLSEHPSDGSRPPKHLVVGDQVRFSRTVATSAGTGIIQGINTRGWLIIKRLTPKGPCLIDPVTRAPWKVLKLDV